MNARQIVVDSGRYVQEESAQCRRARWFLLFCCRELQPACTRKNTSAACSRGCAQQQRSPPSQQQRTAAFPRSALPPLNAQFQHLYMWVLFAVMPLGFQARTATIAEPVAHQQQPGPSRQQHYPVASLHHVVRTQPPAAAGITLIHCCSVRRSRTGALSCWPRPTRRPSAARLPGRSWRCSSGSSCTTPS